MQKLKLFKELAKERQRQNRLIRRGEKNLPGKNFQRLGCCLSFERQE
jgi:hypothetical protein